MILSGNTPGLREAGWIPQYRQLWEQQLVIDVPAIMPADAEGAATVMRLGHLQLGLMPLVLQVMPLVIAIAIGGFFFLGCVLLWAIGARAGVQPRPEVEIDLTPSRAARFFGLVVILLVGLVYYFFF
jgi:hypothetical protein